MDVQLKRSAPLAGLQLPLRGVLLLFVEAVRSSEMPLTAEPPAKLVELVRLHAMVSAHGDSQRQSRRFQGPSQRPTLLAPYR